MAYNTNKPIVWLTIPCYNEASVLPKTAPLFLAKITDLVSKNFISNRSKICFVDDGSTDETWSTIESLAASNEYYIGLSLSHNSGHQNALFCGLMEARQACDAVISIDCDGQDDINAIDEMVNNFLAGDDIVYGVRSNRDTDSIFKRKTAELFYSLMNKLGAETIFNHADYRLMSARALDALSEYEEVNLFLRGMVPLLGFKHSIVKYTRKERLAGESHYTLRKMGSLALNGVTNLSIRPVHLVSVLGFVFSLVGFIGIIWAIIAALSQQTVAGWASTIVIVCLIGGLQLLALGIIGEYVGKIYMETKRRPRYFVQAKTWESNENNYTE